MTDVIVPPAVVVTAPELQSPVVVALQNAFEQLKTQLEKPAAEQAIVTGVFTFFATAFPVAAPVLATIEKVILSLISLGGT